MTAPLDTAQLITFAIYAARCTVVGLSEASRRADVPEAQQQKFGGAALAIASAILDTMPDALLDIAEGAVAAWRAEPTAEHTINLFLHVTPENPPPPDARPPGQYL
jgi:hypothetical protein